MSKLRPSLGGTKPNVDPASMTAAAIADMTKLDEFFRKDSRDNIYVSAGDIRKTFNARIIPCSLDEFAQVDWPDLAVSVDEAVEQYPAILEKFPFFTNLSENAKIAFLNLLAGVHTTAQGIIANTQIQPITLERESPDSEVFFLVDGERRTLSVLYSKGKIPKLRATVFNSLLTDLERAKIKDMANSSLPLTLAELMESKRAIYKAMPTASEMTVRDLTTVFGFSKSRCAVMKKAFDHPRYDFIVNRITNESLGWRELDTLLNNPDSTFTDAPLHQERKQLKTKKPQLVSGDTRRLEQVLSEQIGFPSKIKFAEKSKKVTISLSSTLDQFNDLLAAMKRVKPELILDQFDGSEDENK